MFCVISYFLLVGLLVLSGKTYFTLNEKELFKRDILTFKHHKMCQRFLLSVLRPLLHGSIDLLQYIRSTQMIFIPIFQQRRKW